MKQPVKKRRVPSAKWLGGVVLLGLVGGGATWRLRAGSVDDPPPGAGSSHEHSVPTEDPPAALRVQIAEAQRGGLERSTTQPVSVHAFESAELFAKVSGYVKALKVDIGDHVHVGQLLLEIDQPELAKDVERREAAVQQAQARIVQMQARVRTAEAEVRAARAAVEQAQAEVGRCEATLSFREKQYARIKSLFDLKSIDERLVDEKFDEREAAAAAKAAAIAHIATTQAQAGAAEAKVEQARADVTDAEAAARLAQAELERTQVLHAYTRLLSPYEGVITARNVHVGDFIRDAEQGQQRPVLVVQKTDVMRAVVEVPDRDIPYLDVGDPADVELDTLPGRKFETRVARKSNSEDPATRTMRTEIDLVNSDGILSDGMYGRARIRLEPKVEQHVTIPSSCLAGAVEAGRGNVFVVRDGKAVRTPVMVTLDNGSRAEISAGLSGGELLIVAPSAALPDGTPVEPVADAGTVRSSDGH